MTPLDRLIANSNSIIEALVTFGSNIPQDVIFTWINDDNTTTDVNYMNIVKYQAYLKNLIGMDSTGAVTNSLQLGGVDANLLIDKLNSIETDATGDQTPTEIKNAYNSIVDEVTTIELEAGTDTTVKTWTPAKVKEAIITHSASKTQTELTDTLYKDNLDEYKLYLKNKELVLKDTLTNEIFNIVDSRNVYDYIRETSLNNVDIIINADNLGIPDKWNVGLTSNGEFIFWGNNWNGGFLQNVTNVNNGIFTLVNPNPGVGVTRIYGGANNLFVLYDDGTLYAMGYNHYGEFGVNNTARKYKLTLINTDVAEFSVSYHGGDISKQHTMVLKNNGKIFVTGYNEFGQSGAGDTTTTYIWRLVVLPINVGVPVKIYSINTRYGWSYILTDLGKLLSVGYGYYGQLGLGNTSNRNTYSQVSILDNFFITDLVSQGGGNTGNTIVLSDQHKIYGFGYNHYGELGLGHKNVTLTPVEINISGLSTGEYVVKVYSTPNNPGTMYAMSNLGNLYGTGYNNRGQLGTGDATTRTRFILIMSNIKSFYIFSGLNATNYAVCYAITNNNELFVWGYNSHGELGTNDTVNRNIPTIVDFNFTHIIKNIVATGDNGNITISVLLENGSIYSTGYNAYRAASTGTNSDKITRLTRTI